MIWSPVQTWGEHTDKDHFRKKTESFYVLCAVKWK